MPISCISKKVDAMSKLKDAILSELATSNPSMPPISPDVIDLRLRQLFPNFRIPIHPPYSLMIREAILKLHEESGSSEEAIFNFLVEKYEGLPWGHSSFMSHHLKKLCEGGDIVCVNNEKYMLPVDDGDLGKEDEKMSHRLNLGEEDKILVRGKGREVEANDGWSRVNSDQAEEFENHCEAKRENVVVNEQNGACEQRIEGFEEQREGKRDLIKEVREESQNFREQIEVVEEADESKGMLAEVAQEQRGEKRKRPQKTKQQRKVLKDDISQPTMEEGKKCVEEEQQQIKSGSGVMKSTVVLIGGHKQPQQDKMISKQGKPQEQKTDFRTEMLVFPYGGEDRENSKASLQEYSMCLFEEEKDLAEKEERKEDSLEHEKQHRRKRRKLHNRERDLIIVCALPAENYPQSRAHFRQKPHKFQKDSISASLESMELEDTLLKDSKPSSYRRHAKLQVTTSKRFTQSKRKPAKFYTRREIQNSRCGMSKDLKELEEKQAQQIQKPEREHQEKQIKVYVRRNVSKSQLKEAETSNSLPSN